MIYDKFATWWFCGHAVWVQRNDSRCTEELWNLGRKDYGSLSKWQKNLIMQHFLLCTGVPPWAMQFAVRQWPCDADEQKPKLILMSQTVLLTFQGDWGVLELGPNLPQDLTIDQLTEHVREMQQAQTLWTAFLAFAERLAADLHAPSWACCFEICFRTFEDVKQLRLHAHLFLKSESQPLRCRSRKKLC